VCSLCLQSNIRSIGIRASALGKFPHTGKKEKTKKTSMKFTIFFCSSTIYPRSCSERPSHPSQGSSAPLHWGNICALLRVPRAPPQGPLWKLTPLLSRGYTPSFPCLQTMPPRREVSNEESSAATSTPIEELALALHELLRLQQRQTPVTMQLDTHFQLPKFIGQMNGETVDSWIRSLSTYFKTSPEMEESTKLQIASLQLEGIAQTWWDTQLE
jgi:hypothetical protein